MSKGSKPRPIDIGREEFIKKFDKIDWSNTKDATSPPVKKNKNSILPRKKS
jgi:hypothetical protein